jgi:hypothetical protein
MPSANARARDDLLTLIFVSTCACILQDVLHEAVGHGLTAWLSGAHKITISTVALQSDIETRVISAGGTIVNLIAGAIFWLILRSASNPRPATRYFLLLATAGNLFTGTGYFFFSGVSNFGDWAEVIHGLQPHWAWRVALTGLGVISYYLSMRLIGSELVPYLSKRNRGPRLRHLCWAPYFADGALAGLASSLSPLGLFYMIASALPSTLGANMGFFWMPFSLHPRNSPEDPPLGAIPRSIPWIVTGAVSALFFILVLGRGVSWSR